MPRVRSFKICAIGGIWLRLGQPEGSHRGARFGDFAKNIGHDDLHADANDWPFSIQRQRPQELRVFGGEGPSVEAQNILVIGNLKNKDVSTDFGYCFAVSQHADYR